MVPSVTRNVLILFGVACALLIGSTAQAASVIWTIDSTASTMGFSGTGQAPVSGLTLPARIVVQGTNPLATATPTVPAAIGGQLVTDTDFTSSIKFLSTGTAFGPNTGSYEPLADGSVGKAPASFAVNFQLKFGASWVNVADGALRNWEYDYSGPNAIAITGGSFPTTSLKMVNTDGTLDYRGYGPGDSLGSGTTDTASKIPGDANFDRVVDGGDYTIWADNFGATGQQFYQGDFSGNGAVDGGDYTLWADNFLATADPFPGALNSPSTPNGSITTDGPNYKLTVPFEAIIYFLLDEGDSTDTTTDDIFVDLKAAGQIVAFAPIPSSSSSVPEPSTLALSLVAGLGMTAYGLRRKFRRA